MKIRAKFFAMPRDYQGERELEMEVSEDFHKALEEIDSRTKIGIKEKLDKRFIILINGRNYKRVLEDKGKLEQGDNLAFVPFLGGG
ncbi:MAG: MoaD/ThiS family protein [Elusimicrobiota bacterium]|nr:MoaD/ThiS family protein [Elusimicrobiota bacterium]